MKNLLAENMRRFGTKNLKENIKTNSDFKETVKDIMVGGARGENMTDTILAELGDFYTQIYDSGDTNLIRLYNQLRMSADETPDIQRYSASKLFKYLDTTNSTKNIKTNSDFKETVKDIMVGGARGENMTDTILAELGDFYTQIYDSGDTNLISLYNQLRMSADKTPDIQRSHASKLFKYLDTTNV